MGIKPDNWQPLVSIVVITYNSEKYIIETLESIREQTYPYIELIISDDCSIDNSVSIIENWAGSNAGRFKNVHIIKSETNTGIPSNCNRGLYATSGEWLKFIAGDDTLIKTCIEDNLNYIRQSSEDIYIIHSLANRYKEDIIPEAKLHMVQRSEDLFNNPNISAHDQFLLLLRKLWVTPCTLFFRKDIFDKIGVWDESIVFEDWPYLLRVTQHGFKIHFLNKMTANYRVRIDSYSNINHTNSLFHSRFMEIREMVNKYFKSNLNVYERFFESFEYNRRLAFVKLKIDKYNLLNRLLNKPFTAIFSLYKRTSLHSVKNKIMRNNSMKRISQ